MKRFSLLLTVLWVAGLPLTAAALDYGSDQRMLAAEANAPALPGARGDENPFGRPGIVRHARGEDDSASANAAPAESESRSPAPAHRAAVPRTAIPAVGAGPAPDPRARSVLSWQSLLPGSIQ